MSALPTRRPDLKKYKRVKEDAPEEKKEVAANHILVSASKPAVLYIQKVIQLFNGEEEKAEKKEEAKPEETDAAEKEEKKEEAKPAEKFRTVTFLGRGKAMKQVVQIVEIVKRRIAGLHQISTVENMQVTDVWTAVDPSSGLEDLKIDRTIGGLHITLSLDELDKTDTGYQAPLPESEVKPEEALRERPRRNNKKKSESAGRGEGGRGGGRGSGRGGAGGRGSAAPPAGRGAAKGGKTRAPAGRGSGRGGASAGRGGAVRGRGGK